MSKSILKYPQVDDETREMVEALTKEEVSREVSYSFEHELLWYGVDAVCVAAAARDAISMIDQGNASDFMERYKPEQEREGVQFNLKYRTLQEEGLYVPPHCRGDDFTLLPSDWYNCVDGTMLTQTEKVDLIGSRRNLADLSDRRWMELALDTAQDVFDSSAFGFENELRGRHGHQPAHVTEAGRRLLGYYGSLMNQFSPERKFRCIVSKMTIDRLNPDIAIPALHYGGSKALHDARQRGADQGKIYTPIKAIVANSREEMIQKLLEVWPVDYRF